MPFKPGFAGERPSLGWGVLDWIEENLTVVDGPDTGAPLVLTREQARFVRDFYELDPATGRRIVRRAVLSRPKGWGKSPVLAALCLVEALGPVVPAGWDAAGRPVGMPWAETGLKPKVQITACSEDQCVNTWEPCLDMARRSPTLTTDYGVEPMESFIVVPRGIVERVSSSATSREGFRPVHCALDQTESWTSSNGGHKLAATLRRNLGKTNGSSVEAPNAFEPGADSVAERSWKAYQAQREGRLRDDTGLLYDHREAPADTLLDDDASLMRGLEAVYGESASGVGGWVDLRRITQEIHDPDTDPADARRYYLNQVTAASDAFLASHEWHALADVDQVVPDREMVVLGFDGSRGRAEGTADATALIGMTVRTGHAFEVRVWEQPPGVAGKGWTVDPLMVDAEVRAAFARWNVVGFYCDPFGWEEWISKWAGLYGRRLKVKASGTNPLVAGARSSNTRSVEMVRLLESTVRESLDAAALGNPRTVTHDGSAALARHVLNARRRPVANGWLLYKEHPSSVNKIDASYALALANHARLDVLKTGVRRGGCARVVVLS